METYVASDYIGGAEGNTNYYYGYEVSKCDKCGEMNSGEYCDTCEDADREWCFEVVSGEVVLFLKTFTELGAEDMFNLRDCFVRGMMLYIESLKKD